MARIGIKVEATEENTKQNDYSNLPNGIYRLEVSASDVPVKNEGTRDQSTMLKLTLDVVEPEAYKGRKLFLNLNIEHPNAQAQDIGQKDYAKLLRAMELSESPEESHELHFIPFTATVGMGKDSKEKNADGSPKYAARSEIKTYHYPDLGTVPEPNVADPGETAKPAAANNNQRPAANQNSAAPKAAGARPWGSKK